MFTWCRAARDMLEIQLEELEIQLAVSKFIQEEATLAVADIKEIDNKIEDVLTESNQSTSNSGKVEIKEKWKSQGKVMRGNTRLV